jgi:tryptophanyl-tRNA synthetase
MRANIAASNLTDDADTIALKIRKAKTDPEPLPETVEELEKRPEANNLVTIYAALSDTTRAPVLAQFGGQQFSAFKGALADLSVAKLAPIAGEMNRLLGDKAELDRLLKKGADRAGEIAARTVNEVKDLVGLVRF